MLAHYTVQRCAHTQHELAPVLTTWPKWSKRLVAIISDPAFDLAPNHTIKIADRLLLDVIIVDDRQSQSGCNDFGGLTRTRQRAGDEDIGGNLTGCRESVPQTLSLGTPKWSQSLITLHAGNDSIGLYI
jgi:hypothetical protein